MALVHLEVRDFRCFRALELELDAATCLFTGENASGKTSLLEAIHTLSQGRSFRTSDSDLLRREGAEGFWIHGRVSGAGGNSIPLGLGRVGRAVETRIAGRPAKSLAELAEALPVQIIDAETHQLVEGGPKFRRRFADWGLFHVEPSFLEVWRRYQRALKQRNELLRQRPVQKLVQPWDLELVEWGGRLDALRRGYLVQLLPYSTAAVRRVLDLPFDLEYRPGWPADLALAEALAQSWARDHASGLTHRGPHRAELILKVDGRPASDRLSRGQQKLLAGALILSQLQAVHAAAGRATTLLIDDLPAELDLPNIGRFLDLLEAVPGQRLITAISVGGVPERIRAGAKLFHVEQGRVASL